MPNTKPTKPNFMEKVTSDVITNPYEEIHDAVDEWHQSDSRKSLHQYLGMTELEYTIWVENPKDLLFVLQIRAEMNKGTTFGDAVRSLTIGDHKVASNTQLLKYMQHTQMKKRFFSALIEHIENEGLTYSERQLIEKVMDKIEGSLRS